MQIDVLIKYPIQNFRFDAHPHANWTDKENNDRQKKLKMNIPENKESETNNDKDSLPGNMMKYKFVDLLDGYQE